MPRFVRYLASVSLRRCLLLVCAFSRASGEAHCNAAALSCPEQLLCVYTRSRPLELGLGCPLGIRRGLLPMAKQGTNDADSGQYARCSNDHRLEVHAFRSHSTVIARLR